MVNWCNVRVSSSYRVWCRWNSWETGSQRKRVLATGCFPADQFITTLKSLVAVGNVPLDVPRRVANFGKAALLPVAASWRTHADGTQTVTGAWRRTRARMALLRCTAVAGFCDLSGASSRTASIPAGRAVPTLRGQPPACFRRRTVVARIC